MEPDIKGLLAEKIREVEGQPVYWNKVDAWQKVQDRISSPKRAYRHYYSAAAVLLLMLFNVTPVQQPETVTAPDNRRAVQQDETLRAQTKMIGEVDTKRRTDTEVSHESVSSALREEQRVVTTNNRPHELQSDDRNASEIVVDGVEVELRQIPTEVVTEQRITPIVGVISLPDKMDTEGKPKRKKLLRKLDFYEPERDDSFRNIIIARNK